MIHLSGLEAAIPAANIKHIIFHKYFQIVILIHKRLKFQEHYKLVMKSMWHLMD